MTIRLPLLRRQSLPKAQKPSCLLTLLPLLAAALLLSGCQTSGLQNSRLDTAKLRHSQPALSSQSRSSFGQQQKQPPADIWSRIRQGYQMTDQVRAQPRIEKKLESFSQQTRSIEIIAQRSNPYIHYIVEQLEKNSLPLELALLPAIESAYNPVALSSQRAAGLWQFMPATGRDLNLKQTHWYDARRDVVLSTQAAINYLTYLNNLFDGDWLLTLAAYNSGQGTVSRAIRRNQQQGLPTDYWSLELPSETMKYVPRLLALAQIYAEPQAHNIKLPSIANEPFFTRIKFNHEIELKSIAQIAKMDLEQLQQLNPAFNQHITLGGAGHLLVPLEHSQTLQEKLANISASQLYQWPTYTVRSGDTLSQIAKRNGTSTGMLRELNKLTGSHLKIGQRLKVPPARTATAVASTARRINYQVVAGDNLSSIALRHQVRVSDIKQWNRLRSDRLRVGQSLRIHSSATIYTVRPGDSLSSIASLHNVSINELKNWNTLNTNLLKPGQKLALYL